MLAIAGPRRGRIYDPAAGAGTLLAMASRSGATRGRLELFGQDINAQALRIARLLFGTSDAHVELELGDTLIDDRFPRLEADVILAQPPLNLRIPYRDALSFDPRWSWGVPTGTADWLWVQHAHGHLAERGVAVVVLAPGILFRAEDETIRRRMLEDRALEAVVQLPTGMVPGTSLATAALVLRRGARANRDRVLFVDLARSAARARGELARLPDGDLRRLGATFAEWREGTQVARPGTAGSVPVAELLETGANLLPSRYIDAQATTDTAQIVGTVRGLQTELSRQMDAFPAAAHDLQRRLSRFEERG
jgi:type I restriction enzyme M protein